MIIIKPTRRTDSITVDTTLISADNTEITVDMTSFEPSTNQIKVIPRSYPDRVKLEFYEELKQKTFVEEVETIISNGYMILNYTYSDFQEGASYEVRIKDLNDKLIYRGKAFVTATDDLENYKMIKPIVNNKIIL